MKEQYMVRFNGIPGKGWMYAASEDGKWTENKSAAGLFDREFADYLASMMRGRFTANTAMVGWTVEVLPYVQAN